MPRAPRLRSRADHLDRPDGEAGLTLIELLVAMTIMVVITGAAVAMLISAFKREPEVRARADQIGDARVAMEKMVRELRQGSSVEEAGESVVRFETSATCDSGEPGGSCEVTFDCAVGGAGGTEMSCVRTDDSGGGEMTLIAGVANQEPVFTYIPDEEDPTFVGITLELRTPETGDRGMTKLENGATLRSHGGEGS